MTGSRCEEYRLDADRFAAHAETCEDCRRLSEQLERVDRRVTEAASVKPNRGLAGEVMGSLPIAPWEGAGFHAWPVVVAGAASIVLGVVLLFQFVGISPMDGFVSALSDRLLPRIELLAAGRSFVTILGHASMKFHFLIGISFVLVNIVFVVLLRRPPRGYDASSR